MSKLLTKQLLLSSSYWVLNKDMVKMLGLESAFLLSNFAEAETMMSDENGWFYQTSDTVEKMTTLTRHKQDQCIKDLDKKGILEKDVRGMPPKRYFRINYECLTNQFVKFQQNNMSKTNKTICKKSATNKESSYKELTNKESTKTESIYKPVINYLNEKADRNFKHTTKSTQSHINARVEEGFTLEDFKKVIDVKVAEWEHDNKMSKFIRPQTLFGTKFESYLNQKENINEFTYTKNNGRNKEEAGEFDFLNDLANKRTEENLGM